MAASVLIVDDHPTFRAAARMLLESEGFEVVGEAADGHAGVRAVQELRPDVVLLDFRLPDIDGFEVASRLEASVDPSPVIVLCSSDDLDDIGARIEIGTLSLVRGFIPKSKLSGAALKALL